MKTLADNAELLEVRSFFNSIKTIESDFIQESNSSLISAGTFFLKKPSKFRFSYDPPFELEIVSHLQAILIFDPKNKTGPITYPISGSPFKYLLKEKFDIPSHYLERFFAENNTLYIRLKMKNIDKNILTLKFQNDPISLKGWEIKNSVGEITKVTLHNVKINKYISDQIFNLEQDYKKLKNR